MNLYTGIFITKYLNTQNAVGIPVYTLLSGSLPPTMLLDPIAGHIYGTPQTSSESYIFVIQSVDSIGCSNSASFELDTICTPIEIQTISGSAMTGVPYSIQFTGSGTIEPFYLYSISSGSIPPGLILNTGSLSTPLLAEKGGTISGVPNTTGSYLFTGSVTDFWGCSTSTLEIINVTCAPIVVETITGSATTGQYYSIQFTGSGLISASYVYGSPTSNLYIIAQNFGSSDWNGIYYANGFHHDQILWEKDSTHYIVFTNNDLTWYFNNNTGSIGGIYSAYESTIEMGTVTGPYAITYGDLPVGTVNYYDYTDIPPGLTLNTGSGVISGVPSATGSYLFTGSVTDAYGCQDFSIEKITVQCPSIIVQSITSSGITGVFIDYGIAASGGTGPYLYSNSSGSLPAGTSFNSYGTVSGTPTVTGSFSFVCTAIDFYGCSGNTLQSLNINCPSITIQSINTTIPIGASYSVQLTASGGNYPYVYSTGSNSTSSAQYFYASGFGISHVNGIYSQYSTHNGYPVYQFINGPRTYVLYVSSIGPQWTINNDTDDGAGLYQNSAGALTLLGSYVATNGTEPAGNIVLETDYVELPPGLTLNTGSGVISGTPTTGGVYTFIYYATDYYGCTSVVSQSIIVNCPNIYFVPIPTASLGTGSVGTAYSQSFTFVSASLPVTVITSSLPSGLTFVPLNISGSGSLQGTPTTEGNYSFTINVIDNYGCSLSEVYNLTIYPTITLSSISLTGSVGSIYV